VRAQDLIESIVEASALDTWAKTAEMSPKDLKALKGDLKFEDPMEPEDVIELVRKFYSKKMDMKTAKAILKDMGRMESLGEGTSPVKTLADKLGIDYIDLKELLSDHDIETERELRDAIVGSYGFELRRGLEKVKSNLLKKVLSAIRMGNM